MTVVNLNETNKILKILDGQQINYNVFILN